ncbi:MAG: sugar porter family MFS transporter [Solirubrobacterales bacterium]|nr:sugar porter family MFS transporter [Solirubrobacterales bacterium]
MATNGEAEESARRAQRNVVLTAAIAGLGGLLFGYDTGIIASALLFIRSDFGLSDFQQGMVVAAVPIGAVFGAAFAGQAADRYGRRLVIIASAIVFIIGALGSALSPELLTLCISRVLLGVGVGLASANAPVYISEVAPPEERGRLVTYFQLSVAAGILLAYLVGLALLGAEGWREMLGLGAVPGLALLIGMLRMPQSPRWLVMVGEDYKARLVLSRIRRDDPDAIEAELHEIHESLATEPGGWRDLLHPAIKAALLVGIGLAVLQQVTGINTVIYYAPTIIEFTGGDSSRSAILASIGVGIVNILATIVALRLLDRVGRRPLLMIGVSGMVIALTALGAAFLGDAGTAGITIIAILSLMAYVAAFAISLGPIFWLLNAELYPLRVRSKAAALGTMANWAFNFIVSLTFLPLIALLGRSGAFWFYAAIGLFSLWFCWRFVPETKDKRLEEIEELFEERAAASG